MEKIAQFLTDHIMRNGIIEQEDYEVYRYGFQTGIELLLCILTSIIISVIMHQVWECLLLMCVFFSQRAYVDGIHMKKYISCYLLSCTVIAGGLFFAGFEWISNIVSVFVIGLSLVAINILPYCDNALKDENAYIFFRKRRMTITLLIGIITFILYICGNDIGLRIIMYGETVAMISAFMKRINQINYK